MCKVFLALIAFCLLAAATPAAAKGAFVYVSNYGDGTISQFRVKPNGTLTPLKPASVPAHTFAHALAADARGRFLYVLSAHDWTKRDCLVSQFRIGRDGRLSSLSPKTVLVPGTPSALVVEPSGKFVYVFTREGGVAQFKTDASGRLSPLSPSGIKAANAGGVVPSVGLGGGGHALYGAYSVSWLDSVSAGTFAFTVDGDGRLTTVPHTTAYSDFSGRVNAQPYSLAVTPNGRNVYVIEYVRNLRSEPQWSSIVAQYRTKPDGRLVSLSPATLPVKAVGHTYADPTGRFLYILDESAGSGVNGSYRQVRAPIHSGGRLGRFQYQTLAPAAPMPPTQPFTWAFSPDGRFAYFVEGDYLYLYRRHADGSVFPLRPNHLYAGYGPLGVCAVQK